MVTGRRWLGLTLSLAVVIGLIVAACGGGGGATPTSAPRPTATPAGQPTQAPPTPTRPASATATPLPTATFAPPPTLPPAAEKPTRGGIVRYATVQDTPTLDVTTQEQFAIYYALDTVFNNLVTYPVGNWRENKVVGDLATEWSFGQDGTTLTFKLNPNARWPNVPPVNGRKVTAQDVKFSFDLYRDPASKSQIAVRFAGVTAVEAPDDSTVVLRLKEPDSTVLRNMAWTTVNIVAPEAKAAEGGFAKNVIGTGAFLFKDRQPNVSVTLARNPNYWKKAANGDQLPYIDGIEVLTIIDSDTQEAGIKTGNLYFVTPGGTRDRAQADTYRKTKGVFVYSDFAMFANMVAINWARGPVTNGVPALGDVRVRQAMHKAMDYDLQRKNAKGKPDALHESYITNGIAEYALPQSEINAWVQRDVEGAKKLLADAGYPNGFKINLVDNFPGTGTYFPGAMAIVKQNLADIGITVDLVEPPGIAAAYGLRFSKNYDMMMSTYSFEGDPVQWLQRNFLSTSTQNVANVNDPKLDQLILATRREIDTGKQIANAQAAQRYMMQIIPAIVFTEGEINIAQLDKLKNYRRHWTWGHSGLEFGWIQQ